MAPLNEEQLSHIRDERKVQIMSAAIRVFARRGIFGTKMSMIAAEAGISHGLLYHYFDSKDELFVALVRWSVEEARLGLQEAYRIPGSPLEKITALTRAILEGSEGDPPHFLLIHQARTSDGVPEEAKRLIEVNSMDTYINQLLPLFRDGQEAGELAAGDTRELIACYLTVISGLMVLNMQVDEAYRFPEVDMLLRMITKS